MWQKRRSEAIGCVAEQQIKWRAARRSETRTVGAIWSADKPVGTTSASMLGCRTVERAAGIAVEHEGAGVVCKWTWPARDDRRNHILSRCWRCRNIRAQRCRPRRHTFVRHHPHPPYRNFLARTISIPVAKLEAKRSIPERKRKKERKITFVVQKSSKERAKWFDGSRVPVFKVCQTADRVAQRARQSVDIIGLKTKLKKRTGKERPEGDCRYSRPTCTF